MVSACGRLSNGPPIPKSWALILQTLLFWKRFFFFFLYSTPTKILLSGPSPMTELKTIPIPSSELDPLGNPVTCRIPEKPHASYMYFSHRCPHTSDHTAYISTVVLKSLHTPAEFTFGHLFEYNYIYPFLRLIIFIFFKMMFVFKSVSTISTPSCQQR